MNKITIFLLIYFTSFSVNVNGQINVNEKINVNGQINAYISPDDFDVCPGQEYEYWAHPIEYGCSYRWKATHGDIIGRDDEQTVTVKWHNTTSSGWLRVDVGCGGDEGYANEEYRILSLSGVQPQNLRFNDYSTFKTVDFCSNTNIGVWVDYLNYPNAYYHSVVNDYDWIIPVGWTYNNIVSDGTPIRQSGEAGGIIITPDDTHGGYIKVRGVNTNCDQEYYSNWSWSVSVARSWPDKDYDITGKTDLVCHNTGTITYTATNVSCATYNWSFPSGWSSNGSTSNQIILYPDGLTDGYINVTASIGNSTKTFNALNVVYHTIDIDNPPYTSGATSVCGGNSTFHLNNRPAGSSVNWTKSSNLTYVSGQGTNNYTVRSNSNGNAWVKATISSSCDGPFTTSPKYFWAGKPNFTISGDEVLEVGTFGIAEINYLYSPQQGITNINWDRSDAIVSINGGSVIGTYRAGWVSGYGTVDLTLTNQCGSSFDYFTVRVNGGWYKSYPNPANEFLTIEIDKNKIPERLKSETIEILLYDKMMRLIRKKSVANVSTTINVSDLKPDVYILKLKVGNEFYEEKIIVNNK